MKLKLLVCPSLRREGYLLAALSPHEIMVELLSPPIDSATLQQRIDASEGFDYILPCVGECAALTLIARTTPLVLPKAHDCAHLLLGSSQRYRHVFSENEGAPQWRLLESCASLRPRHGIACTITNTLFSRSASQNQLLSCREYTADLSLLRDYCEGRWDDARFLLVSPGERVVADPIEILLAEPQ